jgi:multidrug efflux pump subunit AcrB
VLEKLSTHLLTEEKEAVESVMSIAGFSFASRGQNVGVVFVRLRPWDERKADRLKAPAVTARVTRAFSTLREANVFVFTPPAVSELGNANGFELQLQDRGNLGHDALMAARNQLLGLARKDARLAKVRPSGLEDTPQFNVDIDQQKTTALGVSLADVNATLASTWGLAYVNDFMDKGRTKRVYMQADAPFRMQPRTSAAGTSGSAAARWSVLRLRHRELEHGLAQARALQRPPAMAIRASRRRNAPPARRWRRSRRSWRSSPPASRPVVGTLRGAIGRERAGPTPRRSWSSSSASPPSTRAGPFRLRPARGALGVLGAVVASSCAGSRTTCTSRSAC